MTARPQDVALLPLPELPVPHGGMTGDYWTDDQIEEYATDYARANVTAALASAQAREEELRAEVEFHSLDAGALRSQMDVLRDGIDVQRRNAHNALTMLEQSQAHAERLAEALRAAMNEAEGCMFEAWLARTCPGGDVESVHRQWEASSEFEDFLNEWSEASAALSTNAAQPGETNEAAE